MVEHRDDEDGSRLPELRGAAVVRERPDAPVAGRSGRGRDDDLEARLAESEARIKALEAALRGANANLGRALRRAEIAIERADRYESLHIKLKRSSSWRMTAPLRELLRGWRKLGRRLRGVEIDEQSEDLDRTVAYSRAKALDDKLWGGFSRYALVDLEDVKASPLASSRDAAYAAWAIARWHVAHGDHERALDNVLAVYDARPATKDQLACVLLEADCRARLGEPEEARSVLARMLEQRPEEANLFLAMANTYAPVEGPGDAASDDMRLSWINRVYETVGLSPIAKADPARPLAIDNLAAAPGPRPAREDGPKVSVIVPAYKAGDTIGFTLRSLLDQTWRNLEIIVVDDLSPDHTLTVVNEFVAADPRVRAIAMEENRGPYVARNAALKVATGEFVTVHDADDWSHPQRIEVQMADLLASSALANYSDWARAMPNLRFTGTFRGPSNLMTENLSSLLFRRTLLDETGGWDNVRAAADRELIRRILCRYGKESVTRLMRGVPLAFALDHVTSLTRHSATHIRTLFHGVRREYHAAAQYWHQSCPPEELRLDEASTERAFPAPGIIWPDREEAVRADMLFVMDYTMGGGAYHSTMNYVHAARAHGLSVALLDWRRYEFDVTEPLPPDLRRLAHERKLRIVSAGERVHASTVVVGYPVVLRHIIDNCPDIACDRLAVIVNQMAARLVGGGDVQYEPLTVRDNLMETFGTEGIWVPISARVRELMEADPRYPAPHRDIWTPLIDTGSWCAAPLRWRGKARARPVVGRHGRDQYTKWPVTAEALRAAYCADRACDVAILGWAESALNVVDALPSNWTVTPFGAMGARSFLSGLDFFVHYPHEKYIEEFGRAPMEAMAVGIPVILPPVFENTFGEAALYAEPDEVWPTIERLWGDEAGYLSRAEAGRRFVLETCGWDRLPGRLAALQELAGP